MRASTFFAVSAFAVGALAQDSEASSISIPPYENPLTAYLTQTDANGVVTGMPPVATDLGTAVTSQPLVVTTQPLPVTTQPPAASLPAGLPDGITDIVQGNTTIAISVNQSASITSVITPTPSIETSVTTGGADPTGADGADNTASPSEPAGEGAGAAVRVTSVALLGAGAIFALFL